MTEGCFFPKTHGNEGNYTKSCAVKAGSSILLIVSTVALLIIVVISQTNPEAFATIGGYPLLGAVATLSGISFFTLILACILQFCRNDPAKKIEMDESDYKSASRPKISKSSLHRRPRHHASKQPKEEKAQTHKTPTQPRPQDKLQSSYQIEKNKEKGRKHSPRTPTPNPTPAIIVSPTQPQPQDKTPAPHQTENNKEKENTPKTPSQQPSFESIYERIKQTHKIDKEDAGIRDDKGRSLLFHAFLDGNVGLVKALLRCGVDPNAADLDGQTIFHFCVTFFADYYDRVPDRAMNVKHHIQIMKPILNACIAKGGNINAQDKEGRTPLHLASVLESDLISTLLELGADVSVIDSESRTPLHTACLANREEHVLRLIKSVPIMNNPPCLSMNRPHLLSIQDHHGNTPFHLAVMMQHRNALRHFMRDADWTISNSQGLTPLQLAVLFDNEDHETLRFFYMFLGSNGMHKALFFAIQQKKDEIVLQLLQWGISYSHKDETGTLPVHVALEQGNLFLSALFIHRMIKDLEKEKRVLVCDENMLEKAEKGGLKEALLSICYTQENGQLVLSSLQTLAKQGNVRGLDFFIRSGIFHTSESILGIEETIPSFLAGLLSLAVKNGKLKFAKEMIEITFLRQMTPAGQSPMHAIAACPSKKVYRMVEMLVKAGGDCDLKDEQLNTPLHYCAMSDSLQSLKALLAHGAKIDEKNQLGETPLHVAVKKGHLLSTELLVDSWAEIDARREDGCSALHIAALNSHIDLLIQLIQWMRPNRSLVNNDKKLYWHCFEKEETLDLFIEKLQELGLDHVVAEIDKTRLPQDFIGTTLPDEVSMRILDYVGVEVGNAQFVCSQWKTLAEDSHFNPPSLKIKTTNMSLIAAIKESLAILEKLLPNNVNEYLLRDFNALNDQLESIFNAKEHELRYLNPHDLKIIANKLEELITAIKNGDSPYPGQLYYLNSPELLSRDLEETLSEIYANQDQKNLSRLRERFFKQVIKLITYRMQNLCLSWDSFYSEQKQRASIDKLNAILRA